MEIYIIVGLIVLVAIVLKLLISSASKTKKVFKNNKYTYVAKNLPMTPTEAEFFKKLTSAVQERYYVFPQIHLSSILKTNVSHEDSLYAFRHINGKSVDYVLCHKDTLEPTYAIELDDYTHNQAARRKRDAEVERIFDEANLPLVRFRDKDISKEDIVGALIRVSKL